VELKDWDLNEEDRAEIASKLMPGEYPISITRAETGRLIVITGGTSKFWRELASKPVDGGEGV
jgi:hypothetical protein